MDSSQWIRSFSETMYLQTVSAQLSPCRRATHARGRFFSRELSPSAQSTPAVLQFWHDGSSPSHWTC